MTYRYQVINEFRSGVPQTPFGTVGPFRMLALHDTEGGAGLTGARGTLQFLIDRQDRNASYHEIWAWDEATKTFTALRIVPATSAAHSINPYPPSAGGSYEPDSWVVQSLGTLWKDPNRYVYAVSVAGTVAQVDAWSGDPDFVAACRRRTSEIIAQFGVQPRLGEHFRFNPSNRTDWGRLLTSKMGGLVFTEVPKEDDMLFWNPVQQDWTTANGTVFFDGAGNKKNFIDVETVRSFAESSDGRWRLVRYGTETLLVDARTSMKEGPGLLPVPGTRIPTTGFGYPPAEVVEVVKEVTVEVPTGITQEQVNAAHADGVEDGTTAEKSRLRTLLGL